MAICLVWLFVWWKNWRNTSHVCKLISCYFASLCHTYNGVQYFERAMWHPNLLHLKYKYSFSVHYITWLNMGQMAAPKHHEVSNQHFSDAFIYKSYLCKHISIRQSLHRNSWCNFSSGKNLFSAKWLRWTQPPSGTGSFKNNTRSI